MSKMRSLFLLQLIICCWLINLPLDQAAATPSASINTTVTEHQSTFPSEEKSRASSTSSSSSPLNLSSHHSATLTSVNASQVTLQVSTARSLIDDMNATESVHSGSTSSPLEVTSDSNQLASVTMMILQNVTSIPHYRLVKDLSPDNWTLFNETKLNASRAGDDEITVEHGHVDTLKLSYGERFPVTPVSIAVVLSLFIIVYFFLVKNRIEHCYMSITILIAGFGNLGAGFVLSSVQHWPVFYYISELLVLEPTLLGLKGNIEMCMGSRLTTQINLGNMKSWRETIKLIGGNLGLDLTQATVVSCIAASCVLAFKVISSNQLLDMGQLYTGSILIASSMLTAVTTSFLLGSLLATVIVVSYKMKMNPDNIASPVAASLGDVITLTFLASYSSLIFNYTPSPPAIPLPGIVIVTVLLILLPLWFLFAYLYLKAPLWSGYFPIFIAVLISTCSGVILDAAVFEFTRYSVFQPVMNGIGGNLVAVHASRMSTALHKNSTPGKLPSGVKLFRSPVAAFWDKGEANIEMARNLVAMAIPAHIVYIFITVALKGDIILTNYFLILYLASATLQILILLYFATHLVNLMWRFGIDPDNTAIPILTATGDFLGSLFLYTSFLAMKKLGDYNAF